MTTLRVGSLLAKGRSALQLLLAHPAARRPAAGLVDAGHPPRDAPPSAHTPGREPFAEGVDPGDLFFTKLFTKLFSRAAENDEAAKARCAPPAWVFRLGGVRRRDAHEVAIGRGGGERLGSVSGGWD